MDNGWSYVNTRDSRAALFAADWLVDSALPVGEVAVPPNSFAYLDEAGEDGDVPNQEAVKGIARAHKPLPPAWRDLGLEQLAERAPGTAEVEQAGLERGLARMQQCNRPITPATSTAASRPFF